ncbi:MAG: YopX family protein [Lachnospiraceae bacterium]|nr:YopX family protein [Lachnospiraceae bacterium]
MVSCVDDGNVNARLVVWDKQELDFKGTNGKENYGRNFNYLSCCEEIEVIGNIFDNPKLLEVEHE